MVVVVLMVARGYEQQPVRVEGVAQGRDHPGRQVGGVLQMTGALYPGQSVLHAVTKEFADSSASVHPARRLPMIQVHPSAPARYVRVP
jgi:hypothetical protein